jgi:hypothetical protein
LQLLGTVALAPAANLTGIADLVSSGSLTDEQRARFAMGLIGFARYNPNLDADAFLHGAADGYREALSRCEPPSSGSVSSTPFPPSPWQAVVDRLRESNDLKPNTTEDATALRDALRRVALPQRPPDRPMLVINGDRDGQVLPQWTQSAVSRSCALGGRIEYLQIPGVGHLDLIPQVIDTMDGWIAARFAGTAAAANCPAKANVSATSP